MFLTGTLYSNTAMTARMRDPISQYLSLRAVSPDH